MTDLPELVCGLELDGDGGAAELDWRQIVEPKPAQGPRWIHLNAPSPGTTDWLRDSSGLNGYVIDALLASETRPRCDDYDDGTLLILRGVNLNPGAEPEDMVSIRMWIEKERLITTRLRHLMAVDDVREQFATHKGPVSIAQLSVRIAARLTERMGPVIEDLSERLGVLEEQLVNSNQADQADMRQMRSGLTDIRQIAISLRRYIAPQREALGRLLQSEVTVLDNRVQGRLRETLDRVTRIMEQMDEARERAVVVQDELLNRISQRMEQTMYVLTVVATIMLPLGFLTRLLGINVGGIPGADTHAFWAVTAGLIVVVAVEFWLLKRMRLM